MTQATIEHLHELLDKKFMTERTLKSMTDVANELDRKKKEWVQVDNFFDAMRRFRNDECYAVFAHDVLPVIRTAWKRQCDLKEEELRKIQQQIDEL